MNNLYPVTSTNRPAVRRLLRALGMGGVSLLSLSELSEALARHVSTGELSLESASAALVSRGDQKEDSDDAPVRADRAPVQTQDAALQALRTLLVNPGIDADAVRSIVYDEIAKLDLARPVVVIQPGKSSVDLPGLQHPIFDRVLQAASANVQLFIIGPAGCGKTHLCDSVAQALSLPFHMNGSLASSFEVLGYRDATGNVTRTAFRNAFENGGLYLADEIDAWDARALLALNAALSNGYAAFPDGMVARHADFRMIACGNTWGTGATPEYVGRTRLDAATLNRFVRMTMTYDEKLERSMVPGEYGAWVDTVQRARAIVLELGIKVVISPRQTTQGAALLAAGWPKADVLDAVLLAGMDEATRGKVMAKLASRS